MHAQSVPLLNYPPVLPSANTLLLSPPRASRAICAVTVLEAEPAPNSSLLPVEDTEVRGD